jgi:hypothetical protein
MAARSFLGATDPALALTCPSCLPRAGTVHLSARHRWLAPAGQGACAIPTLPVGTGKCRQGDKLLLL